MNSDDVELANMLIGTRRNVSLLLENVKKPVGVGVGVENGHVTLQYPDEKTIPSGMRVPPKLLQVSVNLNSTMRRGIEDLLKDLLEECETALKELGVTNSVSTDLT